MNNAEKDYNPWYMFSRQVSAATAASDGGCYSHLVSPEEEGFLYSCQKTTTGIFGGAHKPNDVPER